MPIAVWGWGKSEADARESAADRLKQTLERVRVGRTPADEYDYGQRPIREEILRTIEDTASDEPNAIVTRNGYGALILNTQRVLFLDIDFPRRGLLGWLKGLFGARAREQEALASLRTALRAYGRASFRIYRTASGLRAIAIDREFDPAGAEAEALMRATNTDIAYARLCKARRCFRARLTPKPWRCNVPRPPGQHPRSDSAMQQRFEGWLRTYEQASLRFATCRYLETVGGGNPSATTQRLLELHDRHTRCWESLPLA
jgi:hypothetical protein